MKKRIILISIFLLVCFSIVLWSTGTLTYIYKPDNPRSELTKIYIDTDGTIKAVDKSGKTYLLNMANQTATTFAALDSTPSVEGEAIFTMPSATGTFITDFDSGDAGQYIIVKGSNTAGTIRFGTNIFGYLDSLQLDTMDIATFVYNGTDWFLTGFQRKDKYEWNESPLKVFTGGDPTPSIKGGNLFMLSAASGTVITDFDDGKAGQRIRILGTNQTNTITMGTNIIGWSQNIVLDTLEAVEFVSDGTLWYLTGYYMNGTKASLYSPYTVLSSSATPSVLGKTNFAAPAAAQSITGFTNGVEGQTIYISCTSVTTTFDFTSSNLQGHAVDIVPDDLDVLGFIYVGSNKWNLLFINDASSTMTY